MVVYLDLIIIATIFVNYAFIKTITLIFNEKLNVVRLILALILSCLLLLLFFLPYKVYFVIRYFMGLIIGIVAFKKTTIKELIIKITVYYLMNLTFIGLLVVYNIKSFILMLITVIYIISMYLIEGYKKEVKKTKMNLQKVSILNNEYVSFYDTGNFSTYKNTPIVFIKKKYLNNTFYKMGTTSISTINGPTYIDIYTGPSIMINNKGHRVCYAFTDDIPYDVILNNSI